MWCFARGQILGLVMVLIIFVPLTLLRHNSVCPPFSAGPLQQIKPGFSPKLLPRQIPGT